MLTQGRLYTDAPVKRNNKMCANCAGKGDYPIASAKEITQSSPEGQGNDLCRKELGDRTFRRDRVQLRAYSVETAFYIPKRDLPVFAPGRARDPAQIFAFFCQFHAGCERLALE